MRQPQASSASVGSIAASSAPVAEPAGCRRSAPQQAKRAHQAAASAGACSTRNTIELVYSPPTESPCTMRRSVSATGANKPSVS